MEWGPRLDRTEVEVLLEVCHWFAKSGWASNQALAIYIGMSFFPTAAHKFHKFLKKKCPTDVAKYLVYLGPSDEAMRFLFPIFVEFCLLSWFLSNSCISMVTLGKSKNSIIKHALK